jgi:hypothetical protein
MIQVNRIDANGMFIEPMVLEDGQILTETITDADGNVTIQPRADIISVPVPEGFHHPKWDGSQWVEGKTDAELLEIAKAVKNAELESAYNQTTSFIQSSALGTPHTYVIRNGNDDYSAFFNSQFQFILSTYYDGSPFMWFTLENGDVSHTKDQFAQVYTEIHNHTQTARTQKKDYQTQIAGCLSVTALNNITITF